MYPEISKRCGFDAVAAAAEVDIIHVHFEYLILREFLFHAYGEIGFLKLAFEGLIRRKMAELNKLLTYGRCPLHLAAGFEIRERRTADTHYVDTAVFIESCILCGGKGVLDILRQALDFYIYSVFASLNDPKLVALGIEYSQALRRIGYKC